MAELQVMASCRLVKSLKLVRGYSSIQWVLMKKRSTNNKYNVVKWVSSSKR